MRHSLLSEIHARVGIYSKTIINRAHIIKTMMFAVPRVSGVRRRTFQAVFLFFFLSLPIGND